MKATRSVPLLVVLLCLASAVQAQRIPRLPLSLELRAGGGLPTGDFGSADVPPSAETGAGFGAGAVFHLTPVLGLYGQYNQTGFGCGDCGTFGVDDTATDLGVGVGAQASFARGFGGVLPWVRAGIIRHQLRFTGGGSSATSDPGIGFAAGAGIAWSPVPRVTITPGASFRGYSADFPLGTLPDRSVDVSYVAADLGFAYRF